MNVTQETDLAVKAVKKQFMAYRNGVTADVLRKAGAPYSIIFGLQIPQLGEIAHTLQPSAALARALWADSGVRESRLLAAWLFPAEELTEEEALKWGSQVLTREEADILCFRLLRRTPFASRLAQRLEESEDTLARYCGEALKRNLAC